MAIAPVRYLVFAGLLAVSAGVLLAMGTDARLACLFAFDIAAVVFLATAIPLLRADPATMRRAAAANDANRAAILAIAVVLSLVVLVALATLVSGASALRARDIGLIVATLAAAWLFANTVFTLHYAHLYYLAASGGHDRGGLEVPGTREPGYWEFLYFSFTLGMTFQTSDVTITNPHMRRVVLLQCMVAFVFNMGVLAFAINALGGLS